MYIFSPCIYHKPCKEVTDKDVIGYYYSLNVKNRNKQYIQLMDDGRFINIYCDNKGTIRGNGTWQRIDCYVYFKGMQCFNTHHVMWDTSVYHPLSCYSWINGKLFLGEDDVSYKKTRNKPKIFCEN
jgi:hypothetical protein